VSAPFPIPRAASVADIPDLLALVHSAYRGDASRAGWTTEADLLDGPRTDAGTLAGELADPAVTILLIPDEVGVLACAALTDLGDGRAYFGMFAVRPTAQGAGVGSYLLAHAEDRARALGAVRMEMTVLAVRTELLDWYARRGYAPTGRTRPFPYGDERFGLPRRDDLLFWVLQADLRGS
jgi:GNAT superfamily N-acetyltransferase